jgi:hypothetical protein
VVESTSLLKMRRSNLTEGSNPSLSVTFILNELQFKAKATGNENGNMSLIVRTFPTSSFRHFFRELSHFLQSYPGGRAVKRSRLGNLPPHAWRSFSGHLRESRFTRRGKAITRMRCPTISVARLSIQAVSILRRLVRMSSADPPSGVSFQATGQAVGDYIHALHWGK